MIERMVDKRILRECDVFRSLPDAELEKILRLVVEKDYEAGTVVFQQGDAAEDLLVVREGKIALQMQMSAALPHMNRTVTVYVAVDNEVFGWSAIVEPHIYTLTAVCLQRVKVLAIDGTRFRALLHENHSTGHEVSDRLVGVVASRLDETRRLLISERLSPAKRG